MAHMLSQRSGPASMESHRLHTLRAGGQPGWHTCFPRDLGQPQGRAHGCTHSEREGNQGGTHAFPEIWACLKGEPPAAHTASGRATRVAHMFSQRSGLASRESVMSGRATRVAHMLSQRSGPASRESPRLHTQQAGGQPWWHTCFPRDLGQPHGRAPGCTHSEREGNKGGTHAFPEIWASLKGKPTAAHTASWRATRVAHMLSHRSGPA